MKATANATIALSDTHKADWEKIAELFHDTYETLAPAYGYETREDTKQFDPQSKNGKLMTAVCKFVISQTLARERAEIIKIIEEMRDIMAELKEGDNLVYEAQHTAYTLALNDILSKLREKE